MWKLDISSVKRGLISNVWIREDKQIQERGDLPLQLWVSVRGTMCHPDVCFEFTKIFTLMAQKQAKLISYQAWINTLPIVHSFHMRGLAISASGGRENVKCVTINISKIFSNSHFVALYLIILMLLDGDKKCDPPLTCCGAQVPLRLLTLALQLCTNEDSGGCKLV